MKLLALYFTITLFLSTGIQALELKKASFTDSSMTNTLNTNTDNELISLKEAAELSKSNDLHLEEVKIMQEAILNNTFPPLIGSFQAGFKEGEICTTPFPINNAQIDPHRSLMVHDAATLTAPGVDFSLEKTMDKLAGQASANVPGTTAASIFEQMWDTQNSTGTAQIPSGIHCDDNGGTINGFPTNNCPRAEGNEAAAANFSAKMAEYSPTALVNRIDLSHKGWKNCGEHRIIYGKGALAKNLIIFEAVLPNPFPGCRSGCRDVVEFWSNLSNDADPVSRSAKLENFFYNGLPGFSPVINVNHYASSANSSFYGASDSGQIRTNQFLQAPWLLKEFKTQTTCVGTNCEFDIVPISVKGNPYGELWNRDIANFGSVSIPGLDLLAQDFQSDTLTQVTDTLLGHSDLGSFSYAVEGNKNAADSNSQGSLQEDNYRRELINVSLDPGFEIDLNNAGSALTTPLTATQIANRATALSCAGCHMPSFFGLTGANAVGPGQSWPNALNFVHVDVIPGFNLIGMPEFDVTKFAGNPNGFNISPALQNNFLPAREDNLVNEYNKEICNCEPNLINIFEPIPGFIFKKQLVFSDAIKNLIDPAAQIKAKEALLREEKIFNEIEKPSAREIAKTMEVRKEIIEFVESDMLGNKNLNSIHKTRTSSIKTMETISIEKSDIEDLEKRELGKFKVELAKEHSLRFPPRETVNSSFRVH